MKSVLVLFLLAAAAAAQSPASDLTELSWISGCWESATPNRTITERWGPPTSNMLIGVSQTVKAGKTTAYEFLRVAVGEKGPSYIARPSTAKDETEFRFARSSKTEIVFENLQHDFPQRIIYKMDGPDRLTARAEGEAGGKLRGTDFKMTRIKC